MGCLLNPYIIAPAEGGGGGELPAGATWHLDFVNGFYYAGGSEQAVEDLLGVGFDAGEISGAGMDTSASNANRPEAIGDLLTDILTLFAAGQTVVVEIDGVVFGQYLTIIDDANPDDASMAADSWAQSPLVVGDWDALFVTTTRPVTDQIHRIAFTHYRDIGGGNYQSAIAVNGGAASTGNTAYNGTAFTPVTVGILHGWDIGVGNAGWVCRSITGYPAVTSAELTTLSALV